MNLASNRRIYFLMVLITPSAFFLLLAWSNCAIFISHIIAYWTDPSCKLISYWCPLFNLKKCCVIDFWPIICVFFSLIPNKSSIILFFISSGNNLPNCSVIKYRRGFLWGMLRVIIEILLIILWKSISILFDLIKKRYCSSWRVRSADLWIKSKPSCHAPCAAPRHPATQQYCTLLAI